MVPMHRQLHGLYTMSTDTFSGGKKYLARRVSQQDVVAYILKRNYITLDLMNIILAEGSSCCNVMQFELLANCTMRTVLHVYSTSYFAL